MAELLEHTFLSAHDPTTGRLDALRLADGLALGASQMARIVGYTPNGLRKNPSAERLQGTLGRLVQLVATLRELLDGDMGLVRIWFKAPHPQLDGLTPLEVAMRGRLDLVESLVHAIEAGQPD